jgi:hypothetical protein
MGLGANIAFDQRRILASQKRRHVMAESSLTEAIRGEIVKRGLFTEQEVAALIGALERHLDDPRTVVTRPLLFQAWGRKPG